MDNEYSNKAKNNKFYSIISETHFEFCACRREIQWDVVEISGENNANGFIVQHFSRRENSDKRILLDNEYYESWKVVDGEIEGSEKYDDAFAVACPENENCLYEDCLLSGLESSYSNKGEFIFHGCVFWVSIDSDMYCEIDKWKCEEKEAGNLRSKKKYSKLENKKPLFVHSFSHRWDLKNEDKYTKACIRVIEQLLGEKENEIEKAIVLVDKLDISKTIKDNIINHFRNTHC